MSDHDLTDAPLLAPVAPLKELVASIAHEVSQPLWAIVINAKCCLSLLCKEQPDLERARKAAERIVRNGQHASEVIRSVRAMHGEASPRMSLLNVNDVIADTVELMSPEIQAQWVTMQTTLCHESPCIQGDRIQIQQVLINLMRNAIDAMSGFCPSPRTLHVCSWVDDAGDVSITVSDTGPGLDPEIADRIFEPFFTTKAQGMGLGLMICRSIVSGHGGHLWARPRVPHGCTFEITLPAWRR